VKEQVKFGGGMKRFCLAVIVVAVAALALNGCVSISRYTPPGEDDQKPVMKMGTTGEGQPKFKVEVELLEKPDLSKLNAPKTVDTDLNGNRGSFEGGVMMARSKFKQTEPAPVKKAESKPEVVSSPKHLK